ncbi:hypothetical protein FISHEDRAFT_54854 [Fistulina hepatica ATCC 64428]|uniref:Uncharacterized protein n=1 Tax=Fistulina hepatica ATCC 64428 TaxID=1128425 RepID=A0A0D7APS8_9AGAR|nr:hypothetical protein FISHEDRAFT_54854 [Fistulina hepatica ATCC 64428]
MFWKALKVAALIAGILLPAVSATFNLLGYAAEMGDAEGTALVYIGGTAYYTSLSLDNATTASHQCFASYNTLSHSQMMTPYLNFLENTYGLYMYIITTSGALDPVGFASEDDLPDGAVDGPWGFYGPYPCYIAHSSDWVELFLGKEVSDGLYEVSWNEDNTSEDDYFVITVKSNA